MEGCSEAFDKPAAQRRKDPHTSKVGMPDACRLNEGSDILRAIRYLMDPGSETARLQADVYLTHHQEEL